MIDFNANDVFTTFFVASKQTQKKRMDICDECPEFSKKNICKKCGCFMKVKSKLALSECPIGKW